MSIPFSLFKDLPAPPTTRAVADRVRQEGRAGLPSPLRRAGRTGRTGRNNDALYQEVTCRSALNRVRGMPFEWTLNPYRGCTHGCHYCFARRYQSQLELDASDDFSSVILVKTNFAEVLRRELVRDAWRARAEPQLIAFGTATDPYQPIEGHYRLSRQALAVLVDHPTPVSLVTKGPLVLRDRDLLAELSQRTRCSVSISIPTVDEEAWQRLEPGTAHPLQRLKAVRQLVDAGIDAGVLMAPTVPGISSHPRKIERTIRTIAEHGAKYVGGFVMHLEGGTRDHFLAFLRSEFPHLVERYGQLYASKYPAPEYRKRVRAVVATLTERYGLCQPQRNDQRFSRARPRDDQADQQQELLATGVRPSPRAH